MSSSEKTNKIKDNQALTQRSQRLLDDLRLVIENMDEKRGKLYLDWLENQNKYLIWEEKFNPMLLRKFNRAEIVFANFGFNVGAEYGGMHYAVIVEKNKKSNPLVNVVPLTSLKDGQAIDDLHSGEVYLGEIQGLNDKESVAIINQLRPISKLRIFKPRLAKEPAFKLSNEQMDLLDQKIKQMYTKGESNT